VDDVSAFDVATQLAEMLQFLEVQPGDAEGSWVGEPAEWSGDYFFGGLVIGQALVAATRDAPAGARVHSMHAYFLRPVRSAGSITYRVDDLRAGRSFTARRLQATQADKAVLDLTCSFTADTDGYVYDLAPDEPVPPRDGSDPEPGPGPWVSVDLGPSPVRSDGTRQSTHRKWFRIPAQLPDDPHLHTALIGFATDWTEIGGRPLHLEGDTQGMVSLDHAAWFHRPPRADSWLYYDVHSLVNAGGRGLIRGVMRDGQGTVVASMAQEMRLTPI
jgi:acyl-CoA thioesterase-2